LAKHYNQGRFQPKFPEKYVGDATNIVYRSSWELKFMNFADKNAQVIRWGSEEIILPYYSQVDNKMHRYYPDFVMLVEDNAGQRKRYLVEIKPESQTVPPKPRSRVTRTYINELATYSVNTAKWNAADAWCKKNNMEFLILTEKHLNV
jgi:hypothetical protein